MIPLVATLMMTILLSTAGPPSDRAMAQPKGGYDEGVVRGEHAKASHEVLVEMRRMANLQQQIAGGDRAALDTQAGLLKDIALKFAAMPGSVWSLPRNYDALVKYVLSGGDPAPLRANLDVSGPSPASRAVAEATLDYAAGKSRSAAMLFDGIDISELGPSLAGHALLVKAILAIPVDAHRALRYSEQARLLSPGTLIEEAALRLAVEIAITARQESALEAALTRYRFRFPRSPYSASIEPSIAEFLGRWYNSDTPAKDRWLAGVAAPSLAERQGPFLIAVAQSAIASGNFATAAAAARLARDSSRATSTGMAEARAIEGAASLLGTDRGHGLELLIQAEKGELSAEYRRLVAVAREIDSGIGAAPDPRLVTDIVRAAAAADANGSSELARAAKSAGNNGDRWSSRIDGVVAKAHADLASLETLLDREGK
jgi:chemotaxis protein MotC